MKCAFFPRVTYYIGVRKRIKNASSKCTYMMQLAQVSVYVFLNMKPQFMTVHTHLLCTSIETVA